MTPIRWLKIRKISIQAMLGLALAAFSHAGFAATALIKVNISLPQVLTTSLSADLDSGSVPSPQSVEAQFRDSKSNGYLVRAEQSVRDSQTITYLYIQT